MISAGIKLTSTNVRAAFVHQILRAPHGQTLKETPTRPLVRTWVASVWGLLYKQLEFPWHKQAEDFPQNRGDTCALRGGGNSNFDRSTCWQGPGDGNLPLGGAKRMTSRGRLVANTRPTMRRRQQAERAPKHALSDRGRWRCEVTTCFQTSRRHGSNSHQSWSTSPFGRYL